MTYQHKFSVFHLALAIVTLGFQGEARADIYVEGGWYYQYSYDCSAVTLDNQGSCTLHTSRGQLPSAPATGGSNGNSGLGSSGGGGGGGGLGIKTPPPPKQQNQEPPKTNNKTPDCNDNPTSENPVVLSTGEKVEYEFDFAAPKLYGLSMSRTYRSMSNQFGMFGQNWLSSYDYAELQKVGCAYGNPDFPTTCFPTSIIATFPDGSSYTFVASGSVVGEDYVSTSSAAVTLRWSGANIGQITNSTYILSTGTATYTYSWYGKISTIQAIGGGTSLNFQWTNNQITNVSNLVGNSLIFNWLNGRVSTVQDSNGVTWTYGYDGNGMLNAVSNNGPQGHSRTYVYEDSAHPYSLTGIFVDGDRYSTYSYWPNGQAKTSVHTGNVLNDSFSYSGNTTTLTNVAGEATTYTFTTLQGSPALTNASRAASSTCMSGVSQRAYDANGFLDYEIDWNNNKTDYTYDSGGNLQDWTVAFGTPNAQKAVNSWTGGVFNGTTFNGVNGSPYRSITYNYASGTFQNGLVSKITEHDFISGKDRVTQFDYTFYSNGTEHTYKITRNLPTGAATTTYTYDVYGNLSSLNDASNVTTYFQNYNGAGYPGTIVDITGISTDYTYDSAGNVLSSLRHAASGNVLTQYTYNGFNQVTSVNYADGSGKQYTYTKGDRLQAVGNSPTLNEFVSTTFDPVANVLTASSTRNIPSASGSTVTASTSGTFSQTTQFDSLNRPLTISGNHGQSTSYSYDGNGNVLTVSDALNHTVTNSYDSQDRLSTSQAPDTGLITYGYGNSGYLRTIQDGLQHTTTYTKNGFGLVTNLSSPDSGSTSYNVDAFGRVLSESRQNGKSFTYTWDNLDRMTSRTSAGVVQDYYYDLGLYGQGRLTGFDDATGSTNLGYDSNGNLTKQYSNIVGANYTVLWSYDSLNRFVSMQYPSGLVLSFAHDSVGRVSSITSNLSMSPTLASGFLYEPATSRMYAYVTGNGLIQEQILDSDGRVTTAASPGVSIFYDKYTYNADNTVATMTDTIHTANNETFGYDASARLTAVTKTGDNQTYGWDFADNRTTSIRSGTDSAPAYVAGSNRIASFGSRGFGYSGSGQISTDGTRAYFYDAFDNLAQVNVGGSTVGSYRTNALNQRVYKSTAAGSTIFIYDPAGHLLEEIASSGVTDYVWLGRTLLGIVRGGQFMAAHNDRLGRPKILTYQNAGVAWRMADGAFDSTVAVDKIGGFNIGFPGQYTDVESGLYYNWNRYYDPTIGRYIQSDPIGLHGGINTYGYARANPLIRSDILGLSDSIDDGIASAIVRGDVAALNDMIEAGGLTPTQEAAAQHGLHVLDILKNGVESESRLAELLGKTTKQIKDAIHDCKHGMRGKSMSQRNPDVIVDPRNGEVYFKFSDGHLGDSIGNIFDYLP